MGVKPGYKRSEVGVIPEEWPVAALADVSEKIMVGIASAATHAYRRHGVPLLRNQNIKAGYLDDADVLFVDEAYEQTYRNKRLRAGDLLTARTGYPGMTCVVPERYTSAQSFTTLITRPKADVVDCGFLSVFINSSQGQRFFDQSQIGGAQKNVNAGTLRKMPVPVPALAEQRTIAAALSDVDALLGGLDRLIAKKRDLKQAAMQQLLTGQTRLPGFSGEWKPRKFSELLKYERPDQYIVRSTEYEEAGGTPVLTANKSFVLGYTSETFGVFDSLPVIIFDDFTTDSKYVDFPFKVKSSAIKILKARSAEANLTFVAERMRLLRFPVGEHKRYYISEYQHVELPTPASDEQSAIAAVLSDMDAEIAALEARRDKTRDLKQAMMQELLTGKTRLVKPEAAHA